MLHMSAAILICSFLSCIEAFASTSPKAKLDRSMLLRKEAVDGMAQKIIAAQSVRMEAFKLESLELKHKIAQLERENERLRRKNYLLEIRKDGCQVHAAGFGDGDDWAKRWACFPSFFQAKYCMASEETHWGKDIDGDCASNPYVKSSVERYGQWKWTPPQTTPSRSESPNPRHTLMKMGPPYGDDQFTPGLFEKMRMNDKGVAYWDMIALNRLQTILDSGGDVSPTAYPSAHKDIQAALNSIGGVRNKTVLVLGSISPWLESIALHGSAKQVTTVDYNQPILDPEVTTKEPRLNTRNMAELLESGDVFDVILSYSSIEHDGLGRYGDPHNPDGDLIAQREAFLMLRPDGKYILGTLGGQRDSLFYVSARAYGPVRMPVLARGWKYENAVEDGKATKTFKLRGYPHNVMILSKPHPTAAFLEDTYGEEGCALHCAPAHGNVDAYCFPEGQKGKPC